MAEDRYSISSSRISAVDVSRASFAVVRRGFDPREVRSVLEHVSQELELWENRETELRRAVAAAEERARNPVIKEEDLTAALGAQSAQVLRTAHDEARHLLESAQTQANEMLQSAQLRASAGIVDAEQKAAARVGDAEANAATLEEDAASTSQKIIGQAQADGETLVARAREQGRSMIDQAQEARNRVLADMNARRRMMHLQIEQLRAARDELARSIIGVRETIDQLTDDISQSDEAARAAAQEVARRQPTPEELSDDAGGPFVAVDPALKGSESEEGVLADDSGLEAPESQVVEELFAKIRASARSETAATLIPESEKGTPSGPDAALFAARDGALSASRSTLTRKVKRTLQDEQNHLLEALREGKEGETVLEEEAVQIARFASAVVDPLGDAANAGKIFAHDHGVQTSSDLSHAAVVEIAEELAQHIAIPLRRRLSEALVSSDPGTQVNGAFREWRGSRLERVVGDAALEAFSAAVVAASGSGSVRWTTGGLSDPCPDCADNELEGTVRAGSRFPTGQSFPPAHAGCRCAILPVIS